MIEAPAVHVDSWKHWTFSEGRTRATRVVPDGCAVVVTADNDVLCEEMSSGRRFAMPPRPPDAQAWWEANRSDLRGGENWKRRRAEAMQARAEARSAPPWTFSGHLYTNVAQPLPQRPLGYFTSFFGASQQSQTANIEVSIWPGLEPVDNSVVLQPVLKRSTIHGAPSNIWNVHPAVNAGGNDVVAGEAQLIQPQGIWGVIRWQGAAGHWLVGFFRGAKGNKGPALGKPFGPQLYVKLDDPIPISGGGYVTVRGRHFVQAICDYEIPDGSGSLGWHCSDIGIQAVFGGLTVAPAYPLMWNPAINNAALLGCGCAFNQNITDASTNGRAQVTVGYGNSDP